jgi:menaquinone-dependent protoporphyrinogen oxidase
MNKVLVIYASHYGQTRAIAMRIAERLRERGAQTDVLDARYAQQLPGPDGYDAVVIGSRVEVGRHASSVVEYIREHREDLEHVPTGFFSVSMAAASSTAGSDPSGYLAGLFEKLDWKPACAAAFAGGLPYRKYKWFTRFVMKRISKAAGHTTDTSRNHDLTDWDAVREFADEVAGLLPERVVARQML